MSRASRSRAPETADTPSTTAPASAWERLILPARVADYASPQLDELCASGEVLWAGSGSIPGGDGWVTLAYADSAPLLLPPGREAEDAELLRKVASGETIEALDSQRRHRDGRLLEVSIAVGPITDENGRVVGVAKIIRDASERAQRLRAAEQERAVAAERAELAEATLSAAQRDYVTLSTAITAQSLYSTTDPEGTILDANEYFCHVSGYARDELVGRNHRIVSSGVHPRAFWSELWETITAGRFWQGEVCNRAKDGSPYWLHSVIVPVRASDGTTVRYLSVGTDITARKQAESGLLQSMRRDVAERGVRAASALAAQPGEPLLVLDNLEQIADDAGSLLLALLAACVFFATRSDRFLTGANLSLILQQVNHGIAVRMAVMAMILGQSGGPAEPRRADKGRVLRRRARSAA